MDKYKKTIIITGLDGDFNRVKFGDILELIPVCDSIKKLHSFCSNCSNDKNLKPGIFTHKKVKNNEVISIGADDIYMTLCRECYISLNIK